MACRLAEPRETWSKNLIALGDFNVNKGPLYDALTATGLTTLRS